MGDPGGGGRRVHVVGPPRTSLGPGLAAALEYRGWAATGAHHRPAAPGQDRDALTVLIVEDDDGRVVPSLAGGATPAVCVASTRALPHLLTHAARGAVVLDGDAPFRLLVRLVDDALREAPSPRAPHDVAHLRARVAEAVALDRLTVRERDTLAQLMAGASAAQIAVRHSLSLHTVRSHIKSVLAKLGVGSQVAATALAERSARLVAVQTARAQFTNPGDEP